MKVVIGVDDSPFSNAAVEYAKGTTWPAGSEFLVIAASAPVFVGAGEGAAPGPIAEINTQQEKYYKGVADEAAASLRAAGLNATGRMIPSDPRGALVDSAKHFSADLIIVGSQGRSGITKLLLGSVAAYVVSHAPCNVLVVKRT